MKSFSISRLALWSLTACLAGSAVACASHPSPPPATAVQAPVTTLEMDPIVFSATKGPQGLEVQSFDAQDLFEQGGKALGEKRYDEALASYDRLLREFHENKYSRAALYNAGLAEQGRKNWEGAVARFKTLLAQYGDTSDAKDALFQLGATYAEMGRWQDSQAIFTQLLERKDLSPDDRMEAFSRRGFAQFNAKDPEGADRTFRQALAYYHQVEADERFQTDFYLALAEYHLALLGHERFRAAPLRLPESQMSRDLDEKAKLLLSAQRQYIETIKLGNPQWASASGYQVGAMYEELYDAFMHAPVPPEYLRVGQEEKLDVYYGELRKKIRILLEKSIKTHEANLLMMERLGVQNEWRDRSKLAFAKLQQLLDPSFRPVFANPGTEATPVPAPPAPGMPTFTGPAGADPTVGVQPGSSSSPLSGGASGATTPQQDQSQGTPGIQRQVL